MSFSIWRSFIAFAVCSLLATATPWAASDLSKSSTPSRKSPAQKTVSKSPAKPSATKASSTRRRSRREGSKARLARLKMQPERATEIQQALFRAGYLNQEPTGVYDDATRNAMRRFQTENGFPATGLPEAKSLMKLGLGPHPLPSELDPSAQARAMVMPADAEASSMAK